MIATLLLTVTLNIIGVYFKKIPDFSALIALSPYFSNEWVGYMYAFIVPMLLTGVIYLEMKFYYGVISVLLPDNVIGYLTIAVFQTSHWIAFGLKFFNNDSSVLYIFLILLIAFYVMIYAVKEESDYKSARNIYLLNVIVNYVLLVFFVFLQKRGKSKGISFVLNNRQNFWNKLI